MISYFQNTQDWPLKFFEGKLWIIPNENEEGLIQEKSVMLSELVLTLNNGEFGYSDAFF